MQQIKKWFLGARERGDFRRTLTEVRDPEGGERYKRDPMKKSAWTRTRGKHHYLLRVGWNLDSAARRSLHRWHTPLGRGACHVTGGHKSSVHEYLCVLHLGMCRSGKNLSLLQLFQCQRWNSDTLPLLWLEQWGSAICSLFQFRATLSLDYSRGHCLKDITKKPDNEMSLKFLYNTSI